MSLEILLSPPSPVKPTQPCKVGRILAGLDEPYKSALTNHLTRTHADGGYTDEFLSSLMGQAGFQIGATTVRTHRKGMCACE